MWSRRWVRRGTLSQGLAQHLCDVTLSVTLHRKQVLSLHTCVQLQRLELWSDVFTTHFCDLFSELLKSGFRLRPGHVLKKYSLRMILDLQLLYGLFFSYLYPDTIAHINGEYCYFFSAPHGKSTPLTCGMFQMDELARHARPFILACTSLTCSRKFGVVAETRRLRC